MIKFRSANLILLVIAIIWIYLGLLPWREQLVIKAIQTTESSEFKFSPFPFSVDANRSYVRKKLTQSDPDLESLALQAQKNISQRPLLAYSWLDLAEIKYRQGEDIQAVNEYVSKAQSLWPTTSHSLYLVASFLLKTGELDKSIQAFGQFLETRPSQVPAILSITPLLEPDTDQLVEFLFSDSPTGKANRAKIIKRAFNYSIKHKKSGLAASIWNKFNSTLLEDNELVVDYIKYLIRQNQIKQALAIWKSYFGEQQIVETFLNSGFESEMIQTGFGWKIANSKEFEWGIDNEIAYQGERSFMLKFSGESNIHFHHIEQLIPVVPGAKYRLSTYWRGQNITTRSTPHIELSAVHSDEPATVRTKTKRGNWSWEKLEAELEIPQDSSLLRVRIRRNKTKSLDKNISGSVWFDDFKITRIDSGGD